MPTAQLADAAEGSAAACSGLGCAQEAFDAVARPFVGLGPLIPSGEPLALSALATLRQMVTALPPGSRATGAASLAYGASLHA